MSTSPGSFISIAPLHYHEQLPRFGWTNADFDTCFRFGVIRDDIEVDNCKVHISSVEDRTGSTELCTVEHDGEEMYIHFPNIGVVKVAGMSVDEEKEAATMQMEIVSPAAEGEEPVLLTWYGTTDDVFGDGVREVFPQSP